MRVLGIIDGGAATAVSTVRCVWPLHYLNQLDGFETKLLRRQDIIQLGEEGREAEIEGWDLYVNQRIHHSCKNGNPFRDLGGKVIYDTDDDLTDQFRVFGKGHWIKETVQYVDAITTSSDFLAQRMAQFGRPTYVLPNALDVNWYQTMSRRSRKEIKGLVIGLIGTKTHFGDWYQVVPALQKIADKYPEVVIACGGYQPPYMHRVKHLFVAGLPFHQYPYLLRQFDIRLCPLEAGDQFTMSKSPIAALEAMASAREINGKLSGIVPIVSDHPVFQGTVTNRQNGLVVGPDDWFDAIELLIRKPRLRQSLGQAGHLWVARHAGIRQRVREWATVYTHLVEGDNGKEAQGQGDAYQEGQPNGKGAQEDRDPQGQVPDLRREKLQVRGKAPPPRKRRKRSKRAPPSEGVGEPT